MRNSHWTHSRPSEHGHAQMHWPRSMVDEGVRPVVWEVVAAELLTVDDARPRVVSRCPDHLEDEVQLVLGGWAGEHGPATGHLVEYTPHAPEGKYTSFHFVWLDLL